MKMLVLALAAVALFAACSNEGPTEQAEQLTYTELTTTPGFSWFDVEMQSYSPNQAMVDSVVRHYSATDQKVCIFVKPTCSCTGTRKLFPHTVKTLKNASVDMSKVEFWSMRATTDKHPYMDQIAISDLPTIVVFRNGVQTARIENAEFKLANADTLIANAIAR